MRATPPRVRWRLLPDGLRVAALALLVLALARPQVPHDVREVKSEARNLMLALDISTDDGAQQMILLADEKKDLWGGELIEGDVTSRRAKAATPSAVLPDHEPSASTTGTLRRHEPTAPMR